MKLNYQRIGSLKSFKLLSLFFFVFTGLFAQEKDGEVTLIKPTSFSISRPLRDIAKEFPVGDDFIKMKEDSKDKKHRTPQKFPLAEIGDPLYGNQLESIQKEMGTQQAGQTRLNIAGQTPGGGGRPFDPSGAVGPNHYIQVVNSTTFRVYDKLGAVLATTTLGNLWTPATGNLGDPIVMYDKPANRWFIAQFGTGNAIYIAVSTSPNPLGTYATYSYTSPSFPDYLKFGIWHDAYYMTSNQSPARVFAFNRSEMLSGIPAARSISITYTPPKPGGFWLAMPGCAADGTLPPSTAPCPIISFEDNGWGAGFNDEVNIYNMSVNWAPAVPTGSITLGATVPAASFDAYYDPGWNDVSQPGTAQKLDGIGGVVQYRAQWKSWTGYNSVVLNWPVRISATQRSIKWAEMRQNQVSGVWSMYQEGIYTPDADTRWMGSICMDNNGSIGLSYMKSNSTATYPGLYYTGRRTCDPLGTLPVAEQLVVAGTGFQSGTNRNGDYAQTTLDVDGVTFWSTSEYMGGSSGGSAARTRIFSYQIAPCSVPVAVSIALTSGTNPTCSGQLVTFTATPTNGGTSPSYQWKVNGANVWFNSPTYSTSSLVSGQTVTCELTSNAPGAIGNPATSNAIIMTVNPVPSIGAGSVTATPNPVCEGTPLILTYNAPSCATANGFAGYYAPASWTLTQTNSNGSVGTTLAPASISMVSSNGFAAGSGTSDYSITIPCAGNVTFDWSYSTIDGAQYDYPQYIINNGTPIIFPGYSTAGATTQTGTASIAVNAGDVIHLQAYSTDNSFGSCTTVISNFTAPYTPSIATVWFDAPTAGSLYAFGSPATLNLNAGTYQFFAELTDNLSGCSASSRIATQPILVNPLPQLGTASATPNYICLGNSVTGTYTLPCTAIANFTSDYAIANWTQALINSNGSVNTGSAPASIQLISSNNSSGTPGFTNYSVTVPCGGTISFNWNYTTVDAAFYDRPRYSLNGAAFLEFSSYSTLGGSAQNGTQTISVAAGQTLILQAFSFDNFGGACTITLTNFAFNPAQNISWFITPTGGTSIGTTNPITTTPPVAGTYAYYAQLSDPNTGCINTERAASNLFVVNATPVNGTATASPTPLCLGDLLNLTYTQPAGCVQNIAFQGAYQPSNWSSLNTNSNGSVTTTNSPWSINLISSDGLSGAGTTDYAITIPCSGTLSFNWKYTSVDGSFYDRPRYSINGAPFADFPSFSTFGGSPQYGTESFAVTAGQTFALQAWSSDNFAGACTIEISNLKAPSIPNQAPAWYTTSTLGSSIGAYSPFSFTTSVAGSQTFYAEVYDLTSFCFNSTRVATNNVQVNPLPTVNITPASVTICQGQSTTLTGTGATTYSWMPGSLTGTSVTVTPASTTIYTVTGTNANGCVNTSTRIVTVNPSPSLGTASVSPTSICIGANVNLSYVAPTAPSCLGANQSGFAAAYAPANWALSNVNSNGTVSTGSAPASISMTSSNGLTGSGSTNYTISVPCTGIVSFNWSYTTLDGANYDQPRYSINGAAAQNMPGFSNTLGNTPQSGTASLLVQGGQTFSLQAYSSDNLGGACTIVISNLVAPTLSTPNQTISWYNVPSAGSSLGSGNPQSTTPLTSGAQTYYAQVTQTTTACSNTTRAATNSLNVIALPNTLASATSTSICQGGSTTLIGSNATSYTWMPGSLSGSSVSVSPASTTTYTVTGTGTGGCTKTATITITVNPLPPVGTTVTNATICSGNSTSITGTGAATYTWQPGALSGTTITVSPATTTTYTVTGTSGFGCVATATRLITVNLTPSVGTSITNATICAGATTSITGTGALTYTWMPGSLSGTTVNVSPASTTTYTVTGTAANGCTKTATRVITVNPLPPVGTTVTNATICAGASTSITGTGAASYTWMPGSLSGTTVNVSPASTTTYTVTGTAANGCTNTATRVITVNNLPSVGTTVTNATICAGASTSITGTGAASYTWMPGSLSGTTITVSPASTTTYTVTGTAANGCTKTATRTITVNPCTSSTITVKAYIQGYYIGAGLMTPVLANQGVGVSTVDVDDVTIELHNTTFPFAAAHSFTGMLKTNGNVVCTFPGSINGSSFYIVFKHRNANQTWSKNPVLMSNGITYDFTNLQTKAYGDNLISLNVANTIWGVYSGDINQDENLDLADFAILESGILNFDFGYQTTDLDGNGNVELADAPYLENNINNFIFSNHP